MNTPGIRWWLPALFVAATAGVPASSLAARPANGLIAYSMHEQAEGVCDGCDDRPPARTRSWIELVRPDGTHRRRFPCTTGAFETCHDRGPAFSPDGRRLALVNDEEIVIARSNGEVLRRIQLDAIAIAWSPDGLRLAYTGQYADPAAPTPYARQAIYVTTMSDPTSPLTVARDIYPWGLSWSSRGLLAWEKLRGRRGIYVSDPQGQHRRRILRTHSLALPSWSFDGGRLAYVCELHWCAVRADGSGKRVLARRCSADSDVGGMAWSPDGREVACVGRFGDLITVQLGTGDRRIVRRRSLSGSFLPEEITWQRSPGPARRVSRCCAGLRLSR